MPLTLADFTETIECKLRKIATVGDPRLDLYHCANCKASKHVRAGMKKPECQVSRLLGAGQPQRTP